MTITSYGRTPSQRPRAATIGLVKLLISQKFWNFAEHDLFYIYAHGGHYLKHIKIVYYAFFSTPKIERCPVSECIFILSRGKRFLKHYIAVLDIVLFLRRGQMDGMQVYGEGHREFNASRVTSSIFFFFFDRVSGASQPLFTKNHSSNLVLITSCDY